MTRKVKEFLPENLPTDSTYSLNVLLPVYVACRAMEKRRISNTETEIDKILRDILEKSTNHLDSCFNDEYVIVIYSHSYNLAQVVCRRYAIPHSNQNKIMLE